jgi:hypothetical protein
VNDELKEAESLHLLRNSLVGNPAHGTVGHAVDELSLANVQKASLTGTEDELRDELAKFALNPDEYELSSDGTTSVATHKELPEVGVKETHMLGPLQLVTFSSESEVEDEQPSEPTLDEIMFAKGMSDAEKAVYQMLMDMMEYSPQWFCSATLWSVVGEVVAHFGANGQMADVNKAINAAAGLQKQHQDHLDSVKNQLQGKLESSLKEQGSKLASMSKEVEELRHNYDAELPQLLAPLIEQLKQLTEELALLKQKSDMTTSVLPVLKEPVSGFNKPVLLTQYHV